MDGQKFDTIVRTLAAGASRRRLLRGAAGALGGLLAVRGGRAGAQPGCRREGHPCEGNQECCPGLECRVTGPGNATRCAAPPRPPTCPKPCDGAKGCCPPCHTCHKGCCVPCPCGAGGDTEK